jgi:hypothetical protein
MIAKSRAITLAVVAGLAALAGAGAYQIGRSNGLKEDMGLVQQAAVQPQPNTRSSLDAQPATSTSPSALTPDTATTPAPSAAMPYRHTITSTTVSTSGINPGSWQAPATAKLVRETPQLATAHAPPSTSTTVIERKDIYKPVYKQRVVVRRHRSRGKVHVARAAKHTAMFVAKLPGRLKL